MKDFYLKFKSQKEAESILYTEASDIIQDENGESIITPILQPKYQNISVIGTIYSGGEWDAEGNVITEPKALPGYHVNVRAINDEDTTVLEPFATTPKTPLRVFG